MRYIEKQTSEPECLTEYKDKCRELGVPEPLLYIHFNRTSELKRVLCAEQHNVCCYCQRSVKGYRIEHSYPEKSYDQQKSECLQLDYTNMFAACIDSQGLSPDMQYCDVAKGNTIIREFIKERKCQTFFRYISSGEIIPNGQFYTLKEYEESDLLNQDEKDALDAIKVLNLNCHSLVEDRKSCINGLLELITKRTKEELKKTITDWLSSDSYPPYIELRIQYLKKYLSAEIKVYGHE